MVLTRGFVKRRDYAEFKTVELYFSVFHILSGNKRWYCRLWKGYSFYGAYGDNKFEAYRLALKQFNN